MKLIYSSPCTTRQDHAAETFLDTFYAPVSRSRPGFCGADVINNCIWELLSWRCRREDGRDECWQFWGRPLMSWLLSQGSSNFLWLGLRLNRIYMLLPFIISFLVKDAHTHARARALTRTHMHTGSDSFEDSARKSWFKGLGFDSRPRQTHL